MHFIELCFCDTETGNMFAKLCQNVTKCAKCLPKSVEMCKMWRNVSAGEKLEPCLPKCARGHCHLLGLPGSALIWNWFCIFQTRNHKKTYGPTRFCFDLLLIPYLSNSTTLLILFDADFVFLKLSIKKIIFDPRRFSTSAMDALKTLVPSSSSRTTSSGRSFWRTWRGWRWRWRRTLASRLR